jgi:hypothetical protein
MAPSGRLRRRSSKDYRPFRNRSSEFISGTRNAETRPRETPETVSRDIPEMSQEMPRTPRLELGSFEGHRPVGGPRDSTHSTYLGRRFSGLRCGSVQIRSLIVHRRRAGCQCAGAARPARSRTPEVAQQKFLCHRQGLDGVSTDRRLSSSTIPSAPARDT